MKLKIVLYTIILCILSFSCLTKKGWQRKYPCLTDTVTAYKEKIVDRPITVISPADSAEIKLTVNCGNKDFDTIVEGSNNSRVEIKYITKTKTLIGDCKCDTFAILKIIKDTLRTQIKTINHTQVLPCDKSGLVEWRWLIWTLIIGFVLGFVIKWKVL